MRMVSAQYGKCDQFAKKKTTQKPAHKSRKTLRWMFEHGPTSMRELEENKLLLRKIAPFQVCFQVTC